MKIPLSPASPASAEAPKPSAATPERAVLESLNLRDGQATLARVVEQTPGRERAAALARLVLDVGGQTIAVDSDTKLEPGTLIRLQRAGDSLRLLETLGSTAPNALSQALAQKLPAQFELQAGLKLIASLSRALVGTPSNPASGGSSASGSAAPAPSASLTPGLDTNASNRTGSETARIGAALARVLEVMPQQTQLQTAAGPASTPVSSQARGALIQSWIQNSGLFTEAQLANAGPAGAEQAGSTRLGDLKSQILRLAVQLLKTDTQTAASDLRQLRPAVSPDLVQQALQFPLTPVATSQAARAEPVNAGLLLRVLAGMINRITVNQLHSQSLSTAATADGSAPPQTWLLELPWLNPQQEPKVAQIRIERHQGGEKEENTDQPSKQQLAQWRLNLALDLDELGPLYFELALTQRSLATKVWAEQETTWRLLDSESGRLRENLAGLGLDITNLDCRHGRPPHTRTRLDHRLVDEKA